jgi:hypothetical protein
MAKYGGNARFACCKIVFVLWYQYARKTLCFGCPATQCSNNFLNALVSKLPGFRPAPDQVRTVFAAQKRRTPPLFVQMSESTEVFAQNSRAGYPK